MNSRPKRILLAEDNATDILLLQQAVKTNQWNVELTAVRDGEEALDVLHRRRQYAVASMPDLVLLDINMPKKDGIEVLAEVKSDEHLRRIPIVVMTTSAAPRDIVKAYDLHANLCMTKPLEFSDFCKMLRFIEQWLTLAELPEE